MSPDSRHPTRVKVAGLFNTLKKYKYVVFLDSLLPWPLAHLVMSTRIKTANDIKTLVL
jgi:hypothetical protein